MSRLVFASLLLVGFASAGFFDDAADTIKSKASDFQDFFSDRFKDVKQLFANDQDELTKNVDRVKDLLNGLKEKTKVLEPLATDSQKATLSKVDEYLGEIKEFETKVEQEGSAKFEENKSKWQELVEKIFNNGGLQKLLELVNAQKGASSSSLCLLVLPVALLLRL